MSDDRFPQSRRRPAPGWLAAALVLIVAIVVTIVLVTRPTGSDGAASGRVASPDVSQPSSSQAAPSPSSGATAALSAPPASSPSRSGDPAGSSPTGVAPASRPPGPRPPDDRLGPVILVPGYGGSDALLDTLATRLRGAGRTTIVLALPDDATGDLRGQAGVLAARVAVALKAGAPSVDLVGYSAGGIVAALFVASHAQEVRRVVTIGSPLHGTTLAGLAAQLLPSACPTACQQMAPGNPLLATLDAAEPAHAGVPWTSMWSAFDEVVNPPESARFAGADNIELQSVCADDRSGHVSLPADPLVAGLTLRGLATSTLTGTLASPSASDCTALRKLGTG